MLACDWIIIKVRKVSSYSLRSDTNSLEECRVKCLFAFRKLTLLCLFCKEKLFMLKKSCPRRCISTVCDPANLNFRSVILLLLFYYPGPSGKMNLEIWIRHYNLWKYLLTVLREDLESALCPIGVEGMCLGNLEGMLFWPLYDRCYWTKHLADI